MTTTLTDIAAQLGVSTASVSRALNGKAGVSDDLRRRVLEAAGGAGYGRTPARSLATSASPIGVIVPELDNPVFAVFAQEMATMLVQQGHAPMLCPQSAPGISEDQWIELLLARDMAGLIVVSGMHADTHASMDRYRRLRRAQLPLVLVNGHVPDLDATTISVDDAAAMSYAVDHLVALGHRSLGLALGPERYVPVLRKVEGFTQAVLGRPELLGMTPLVEHSMFTIEGGFAATSQLLDAGVTAVICASDVMALGAIRAARSRGMGVPHDVSIVGFDGSAFDAFTDPPLTTLRQPVPAMARAAVRALLEELHNGTHADHEFIFKPELVVRSSTGPAPKP